MDDLIKWSGWILSTILILINLSQLRHGLMKKNYEGSLIDCSTKIAQLVVQVSVSPNYMAPILYRLTLLVFGIGPIQLPPIRPELTKLHYYSGDGDSYEIPENQRYIDPRGKITIKPGFLANKRITRFVIRANQPLIPQEIESKLTHVVLDNTPDTDNKWKHRIVLSLSNTNEIYELVDFQMTLEDIPSSCRNAKYIKASGDRIPKKNFDWKLGASPIITIPSIKPNEHIELTCEYTV